VSQPAIDWSPFLPPLRPRAGRIASAAEALRAIRDGSRVFVSAACSTPFRLLEHLAAERAHFSAIEIVVGHLRRPLAVFAHAGAPFRFITLHASDAFGALRGSPWLDVLPCRYSDYGRLFTGGGAHPVDAALVQVSAPGPDGRVSLGVSVGSTLPVVLGAPLVIAQLNPQMPYTFGAGELPRDAFDFLVEADESLLEVAASPLDDVAREIAAHAAGEITDGATLQFGIGAIPDAILRALHGRRDLGLHGGMIGDACIELVESGALTGARKRFGRGLMVAGEVVGTRRLYDWVHRNPLVQMAPPTVSHDVAAVAACPDFVAINSAVEVALDGAVNAESVGAQLISGPGGQPDFAIAASLAAGHRNVLALPSTAAGGRISRIVRRLAPEATATLPRYLADRVVTEYGVARLRGLPLRARAEALARIAHPEFRAELMQTD
jgi:4-hydroxybutyrate CoA-transferase